MSDRNTDRIVNLVLLALLAVASIAHSRALDNAREQLKRLMASNEELIRSANRVGFAGAMYGYEAARQGMEVHHFLVNTRSIFCGTNLPEVNIQQGTNRVEIKSLKLESH